jgi:hypothetical protein
VAEVREEGMDADHGLLRILGIDFVFGFSVFLWNGKNAQSSERFERIGRLGVDHPDAHVEIVGKTAKAQRSHHDNQDTFD